MQEFKITEEDYKKYRKRYLSYMIPGIVLILLVVVLTDLFRSKSGDFSTLPFVLPILAILIGRSFFVGLKRQKEYMLSYTVIISDDEISRKMLKTPDLSISFMEIKEIVKTKKGGFMIRGLDRTAFIGIPRWMNKDGELEQRLQALAPITTGSTSTALYRIRQLVPLFGLVMALVVFTVDDKAVTVICGVLATGLLGWAFYDLRTNKNLPDIAKRRSWIFACFIVAILFILWTKLNGRWFI